MGVHCLSLFTKASEHQWSTVCFCVYVCESGSVKNKRVVADEVREVCTPAGLCGVCFGLQSVLKTLPAKTSNVQWLRFFKYTQCPGLVSHTEQKIYQFNVLTEEEHYV